MSSESTDQSLVMMAAYAKGRDAFEHGYYRESVDWLLKAIALVSRNSQMDGEMQMWLVTAYQAAGQQQEAIALCRRLHLHAHWETRKQSKRLLYILEAPQLETKSEWLTQIPDLSQVNEQDVSDRMGIGSFAPSPTRPQKAESENIDWSQVDTGENNLVGIVLLVLLVILGGLILQG